MRRTKEDAAITREQLLKAALASFRSKGYIGTTLDDIARQAGTTRGAIHWHFGSKAELFYTLIQENYQRMSTAFQVLFVTEDTPLQKLRQIMVRWMQYLEEDEQFRTVVEILTFKTEAVPELSSGIQKSVEGRQYVYQHYLKLIQEAIAAGEIRPEVDPETATIAALGLVYGTVTNWLSDQKAFSLHARAETIVDFFLHGLQKS